MNFVMKVALSNRRIAIMTFTVVGILAGFDSSGAFSQSVARLEIKTLSSRPDLVSGGDALVEVKAPAGAQLNQLTLTLNGQDVTNRLRLDATSGGFRGLINGMVVGENTLIAKIKSPKAAQASLKITNYPITGPILSGPHLTPYECRTVESGLGQPLDANCSAKQKVEYFYRASNNTFKPLADPTGPRPSDLINTTTNDGKTVPYIVRVDSGTINRTIYRIAILDD
ncbi:MAG: DUF6351 family protein, partial [Blastocatellia bacterium]